MRKIMIADDSRDNRLLFQAYLEDTLYDATFVENGEQAVSQYRSGAFDLIVMDVQMPVMDGLTAARQIRSIEQDTGRPRTPLFSLTAGELASDLDDALTAGYDAHLSKPISRYALLHAFDSLYASDSAPVSESLASIPVGLEELAPVYLAARKREMPIFLDLLEQSNFSDICVLAHNLKGAGASYGFPELTRIAKVIEAAALQPDAEAIRRQLGHLSTYLDTVVKLVPEST